MVLDVSIALANQLIVRFSAKEDSRMLRYISRTLSVQILGVTPKTRRNAATKALGWL
jgi:hypothetical protein